MTKWTALIVAAALVVVADRAWADSCETYAGSKVYTDQCGPGQEQKPPAAAPAPQPPQGESLRDKLFRALSGGGSNGSGNQSPSSGSAKPQTAEQLDQRIRNDRANIDAALSDPSAPDAHQRYDAAMKDMHGAYQDAAQTFPDKADTFKQQEQNDAQAAESRASDVTWATADATPEPDKPKGPDNVMAEGGNVYVCDSAIGDNNPSCREISPSGECTGVTLSDGEPGWRDSIATPCNDGDMAQRQAYLDANPDAASAVKNAPAPFAMDAAGTEAAIKQLTAEPPRPLDDGEKKDWDAANADMPTPSIDKAYKETPMDISSASAPSNANDGSDLDDAIDTMNALSSMMNSLSGMYAPSVPRPTVRPQAPTVRAPTVTTSTPVFRAPTVSSGGSDITGTSR